MPLPFPTEWIDSPPRFIVAGVGPYASGLAKVLCDSVLVTDDLLREGILPPPLVHGKQFPPTPLKGELQAVLVVLPDGESLSSLLWRHRRLWMLPGDHLNPGWRLDNVCWLFIAANEGQAKVVSGCDVLGRVPAKLPFGQWLPTGCKILPRSAGLSGILAALLALNPIPYSDWHAVISGFRTSKAIFAFADYIGRSVSPAEIAAQVPVLKRLVSDLSWESYFPPPQHRWANRLRSWLAVTQPDTPWLEEGKLLFSSLQI